MLPIRPQPQPDELLTSVLIRAALANGLRPTRLTLLLARPRFWLRDPDRSAMPEEIARLEQGIGYPPGTLQSTSLRPLLQNLHGEVPPHALVRHLVQVGRHTRQPGTHGHPVCPACVGAGAPASSLSPSVPGAPASAVRRGWRFCTTVVCPDHATPLIDHCPGCGTPVSHTRGHVTDPSRRPPGPHQPGRCLGCGQALPSPTPLEPGELADVLRLQTLLLDAAYTGRATWGGLTLTGQEAEGVVEVLLRQHLPAEARGHRKWRMEFAPVHVRLPVVRATGALMQGGPEAALTRLRERGVTPVELLAHLTPGTAPPWFRDLVMDTLSRRPHAPRVTGVGESTFRFTADQWSRIASLLPPDSKSGGGRGGRKSHREVLEDLLTRGLRGTREKERGPVSYPTMNRRLKRLAQGGTLDRVIAALLAGIPAPPLPPWAEATLAALTAPMTVRALERVGSTHTDTLWQLGTRRALQALTQEEAGS